MPIKFAWNVHYEYRQDGRYSDVGKLPIWDIANAYACKHKTAFSVQRTGKTEDERP
jgi:hypothetical protein